MTTVVSNSGRQAGKPVRKNQSSNASNSTGDISQKDNEKFQPTAEQLRIASLMTDKRDADSDLKPKIDQIVELTGATRDDAAIALYDCDNDMAKAVEMILDGEALESEWQSTGKKKKQKQVGVPASSSAGADASAVTSANVNGQKNGDDRKFDKSRRERNNGFEENGSSGAAGGSYNTENGRSQRGGKRDANFKPRGDRRGGGFVGATTGAYPRDQEVLEGSDEREDRYNGDGPRRGGFGGRGRGGGLVGRGRGAPRGRGSGRGGARIFGSRPQGTDKPADEFLGSIDTWTNEPKPEEGVNTMKVGNWSNDFNGQEWSTENWNETMENKGFSSADKNGPQVGSVPEPQKPLSNPPTQMSFLSAASKSIEKESQKQQAQQQQQSQQPTPSQSSNFSSIASAAPPKRPEGSSQQQSQQQATSQPSQQSQQQQTQSQTSQQTQQTQVTPGRALLNQIQQPQQQAPQPQQQPPQASPQQPTLKPVPQAAAPGLGLNLYNKNATESIKSLVGLSGNAIGDSLTGDISKQMSNNSRISGNSPNARSKPADGSVEMPPAEALSSLPLQFGSLNFGSSSAAGAQSNFANLPSAQESIFEASPQKPEKNLNSLMEPTGQSNTSSGYRSNPPSAQKNVLSGLSDVLSSEKVNTGSNNYSKKNDYNNMMGGYGKNSYSSDNSYNSGYYQPSMQQQPQHFQPQSYYNQFNSGSLMQQPSGNFNSSTYGGNAAPVPTQQQQQAPKDSSVPVAGSAPTSSAPSSLGLMSNSTNTTNVLKNTLTASKGPHNNNTSNPSMPPGVQNFQHQTVPSVGTYLANNGVPVPFMPFSYQDMNHFRDGAFSSYASADMKFNRGSEADMSTASSQSGVQSITGQQGAHNQPFLPGINPNMFYNFYQPYNAQYSMNPPLYPQMPPTTNSSFPAKSNAGQSYNTHSYNSGYDNLGGGNLGAGGNTNAPGQNNDYNMKPAYGSQQMPHKSMQSSNSGSELSGTAQGNTNGQSMYNKSHSQMNKNFDKQNSYQAQNNQFMGGNNGLNYNSPSYLINQQMHLSGDQGAGQQSGGAGAGQRSMKSNAGGASSQKYNNPLWQ